MTLIELMISIALLGVIIVPLTGAMITGLISTGEARARLSESRSSLFTSSFFADDAQSSDVNGISVGGAPACGTGTNVVSFRWSETDPSAGGSTAYSASYVTATAANGNSVLRRQYCGSGGMQTATVAPVLKPGAPVTVTCSNAAGGGVACDAGTSAVRKIQLVAQTPNAENYFTMVAARRPT